jgi:hypothetical protein
LDVGFVAVCDAIRGAWAGSGETVTSIAARFGVSRGWIHKWVYPELGYKRPIHGGTVVQQADGGRHLPLGEPEFLGNLRNREINHVGLK